MSDKEWEQVTQRIMNTPAESLIGSDERQEMITFYRRSAEVAKLCYDALIEVGFPFELVAQLVVAWSQPRPQPMSSQAMVDAITRMADAMSPSEDDE